MPTDYSKGMPDYRSQFTGDEIDWALSRMFEFDISTNGCIKLKSSENDPYNLDVLFQPGNYVVYYFDGGSTKMDGLKPLRISVTYIGDTLTQYAMILDCVQFRSYIDEEWTDWETWYTTGYIYQQADEPQNPQKDALWINTTDPENPVLYCWNGRYWIEVRPSDVMDITIYDPERKMTDVFKYIEDKIEEFDRAPDGSTFYEMYQIHVSDNTIHFSRAEKKELLAKPSEKELRAEIEKILGEQNKTIQDKIDATIGVVQDLIDAIETDSGKTMKDHFNDKTIHVTPQKTAEWDAKADGDHTHFLDDRVKIDAKNVVQGVFNENQIPPVALEECVFVQNDTERFALTTEKVQNGDTVCVKDGNTGTGRIFYFVIDDTKLDSEDGYTPYSALLAGEIPWSSILDTPTTRDGYGLTDVPTYDEMQYIWEQDDSITTTYISTVFQRSTVLPKITGYFVFPNANVDAVNSAYMVNDYLHYISCYDAEEEGNLIIQISKIRMGPNGYKYDVSEPYTECLGTVIGSEVIPSYYLGTNSFCFTGGSLCPFYEKHVRETVVNTYTADGDDVTSIVEMYGHDKKYILNTELGILFKIENDVAVQTNYNVNLYVCNYKGLVLYTTASGHGILITNPILEIICECNLMHIGGEDYTFVHNRNVLAIQRIGDRIDNPQNMSVYPHKIYLGNDAIILQTEIFEGELYVLYMEAIDEESNQNPDWKAYHLELKIGKVLVQDDFSMEMSVYPVKALDTVIEVGSGMEEDYKYSLMDIYVGHYNRGTSKEYLMSYSNGCIVVYQDEQPLITLGFMNWGVMTNKFVDRNMNTIEEGTMYASNMRRTCYNGTGISTLLYGINGGQEFVSYDGYNYIVIKDNGLYSSEGWNYQDSKVIVINDDEALEVIKKKNRTSGEEVTYGIVLGKEDIATIVDESIDKIDKAIETETGSITSNVELYSIFEYISSACILSGTNGQNSFFTFIDYHVANPTNYFEFTINDGIRKVPVPTIISGAPSGFKDMYIKGGIYRSSTFVILLFTMETGNPYIALAIMTESSINVLNYQELTVFSTLLADDREKFITSTSFKVYQIGKYLYGYMEFSKKNVVTGLAKLANYIILQCDYGIGTLNVIHPKFTDAFYTDGRLTSAIRAYVENNHVYLIRCNATYFTILIGQEADYTLSKPYIYRKLEFDVFNPVLERCIPDPFMLNDCFTMGYTDKTGHLILKKIPVDGNVTNIDTGIQIIDPSVNGKEQYNVLYEENSKSMSLINVYQSYDDDTTGDYHTREILNYYVYDEDHLDTTGILYSGKISNAILSGYTKNSVTFRFPDYIKLTVNYTITLLPVAFFETINDTNTVFGKMWPIMRIVRDTGVQTLAKSYQLTSDYVGHIVDYEERFLSLRNQISSCAMYADSILEIIG